LRSHGFIPNDPRSVLEAMQILVAILEVCKTRGGVKGGVPVRLTDRFDDRTPKELGVQSHHMTTFKWPAYGASFQARANDSLKVGRFYQIDLARADVPSFNHLRLLVAWAAGPACRSAAREPPVVVVSVLTRGRLRRYLNAVSPFDPAVRNEIDRARLLRNRYELFLEFKQRRARVILEERKHKKQLLKEGELRCGGRKRKGINWSVRLSKKKKSKAKTAAKKPTVSKKTAAKKPASKKKKPSYDVSRWVSLPTAAAHSSGADATSAAPVASKPAEIGPAAELSSSGHTSRISKEAKDEVWAWFARTIETWPSTSLPKAGVFPELDVLIAKHGLNRRQAQTQLTAYKKKKKKKTTTPPDL
ncbi:hypothetical protein CTAYLR_008266, partial [Chrysophaeum taylorii]